MKKNNPSSKAATPAAKGKRATLTIENGAGTTAISPGVDLALEQDGSGGIELPALPVISADKAEPQPFETEWVPLHLIDCSPLNYRKYYDPVALQEFAEGLKAQGIISPVTVRIVTPGRFELVVGERRIRAGRLAGLTGTLAIIRVMTDEEVEEAQFAENIGREDTHPMHDAEAIEKMLARGLSIDAVALRMGKSRSFIYQRRRLWALIPDFREMFLAGVITQTEALDIAILPEEAQRQMFNEYCSDWKEPDCREWDYHRLTSSFKCDLNRAPFDLTDTALFPEAGACTLCPHNSGYAGLLFANENGEARCGKKSCFDTKTRLHFVRAIAAAIPDHQPEALIFGSQVPDLVKQALAEVDCAKELPILLENNIALWEKPEPPAREDFPLEEYEDGDYGDESDNGEGEDNEGEGQQEESSPDSETESIDEESFNAAVTEYEEDVAVYEAAIEDKKVQKAFLLSAGKLSVVYFSAKPLAPASDNGKKVKIQEMIKAGLDTPEMLEAEIGRIKDREDRNQELDREKVQQQVHAKLIASLKQFGTDLLWQETDRIAMRWITYIGLPYDYQHSVETMLDFSIDSKTKTSRVYEVFRNLTQGQETYLVRTAILARSESKMPTTTTGHFLYRTAEGAGIDVQAIEKSQAVKAESRLDNQEVKIALYKKRIKRHRRKAA